MAGHLCRGCWRVGAAAPESRGLGGYWGKRRRQNKNHLSVYDGKFAVCRLAVVSLRLSADNPEGRQGRETLTGRAPLA